jgi:predicted ATP-grasp superfamily ATP-dependent carboligase
MDDVRLLSDRRPRRPVLLFAFTGWNDAGEAASGAVRVLAEQWDATQVAEVDPEPFTDFATVRPFVVIDEGRRQIVWPTVDVWAASLPSTDVLLVVGPEPAMQWRRFCEQIVDVAGHFGVSMVIGLGALLAEYPHRRPAHLTANSVDESLRDRFGLSAPSYEGPTGIVGVLGDAFASAGLPTASLWAAVPTYTAQLTAAKATAVLVRAVCTMIGAPVPTATLATAIAEYESRVAELLEDPKLATYVQRLEELMPLDAGADDGGELTASLDIDDSRLVAEVEQFLRESGDT